MAFLCPRGVAVCFHLPLDPPPPPAICSPFALPPTPIFAVPLQPPCHICSPFTVPSPPIFAVPLWPPPYLQDWGVLCGFSVCGWPGFSGPPWQRDLCPPQQQAQHAAPPCPAEGQSCPPPAAPCQDRLPEPASVSVGACLSGSYPGTAFGVSGCHRRGRRRRRVGLAALPSLPPAPPPPGVRRRGPVAEEREEMG